VVGSCLGMGFDCGAVAGLAVSLDEVSEKPALITIPAITSPSPTTTAGPARTPSGEWRRCCLNAPSVAATAIRLAVRSAVGRLPCGNTRRFCSAAALTAPAATRTRDGAALGKSTVTSRRVASVRARWANGSKPRAITAALAATNAHHASAQRPWGRGTIRLRRSAPPAAHARGTITAQARTAVAHP